jgi:hypothetical protein
MSGSAWRSTETNSCLRAVTGRLHPHTSVHSSSPPDEDIGLPHSRIGTDLLTPLAAAGQAIRFYAEVSPPMQIAVAVSWRPSEGRIIELHDETAQLYGWQALHSPSAATLPCDRRKAPASALTQQKRTRAQVLRQQVTRDAIFVILPRARRPGPSARRLGCWAAPRPRSASSSGTRPSSASEAQGAGRWGDLGPGSRLRTTAEQPLMPLGNRPNIGARALCYEESRRCAHARCWRSRAQPQRRSGDLPRGGGIRIRFLSVPSPDPERA